MRRVIVDYAKLTSDILNLLVEKFPDGYDDSDIIRFQNAQNELVEAVEVRTVDTIYLVKVSTKLASRMEKFEDEEEDLDAVIEPIAPVKGVDIDDEDLTNEEDEEDVDLLKDKGGSDDDDDDDDDFDDEPSINYDEEDEDE